MANWSKEEKSILVVTSTNHFLFHAFETGYAALVIPLAQAFGISKGASMSLCFGMLLMFGLGAVPAGILSDKWNVKRMLTIGAMGAGISSLAVGLVPNIVFFGIALTFLGLLLSIYHPTGIALISHSISKRGKALGLNGIFGNAGFLAGPLIAGLCNFFLGWRAFFFVMGAIGLTVGTLGLRIETVVSPKDNHEQAPENSQPRMVIYFLFVCTAIVFAGFLYRMANISFPAFMEDHGPRLARGLRSAKENPLDNLTANLFMVGVYFCGMAGQYVGGHLADRCDLRKIFIVFYGALIPLCFVVSFSSGIALAAAAGVFIFFQLGVQPIENSLIARLTPFAWRSRAYGLKFVVGLGAGSLGAPLAGLIHRDMGFPWVFRIGSLFAVAGSLVAVVLWFVSRKQALYNEKKEV